MMDGGIVRHWLPSFHNRDFLAGEVAEGVDKAVDFGFESGDVGGGAGLKALMLLLLCKDLAAGRFAYELEKLDLLRAREVGVDVVVDAVFLALLV